MYLVSFHHCLLLCVQDWDRLHAAFWDMQAYWNMLERKRKQLERQHIGGQALHSTLPQSIKHIQLDLRDLMSQVSNQVCTVFWLKSTHVVSPFQPTQNAKEEVIPPSDNDIVLLSPPDELHAELLDEADLSDSTSTLEPREQISNIMGQSCGRLRHSEGSRPLPHQAGKRLPPAGFKNAHDSAVKNRALGPWRRAHNMKKKAELTISTWRKIVINYFNQCFRRCCQQSTWSSLFF